MKSRIALIIIAVLILLTWGNSALLASRMPAEMASHWNMVGQADGTSSRASGLWFLPIMQLGVVGLLLFIPRLDPLKRNVTAFESTYQMFIAGFTAFLAYIHGLTLAWNLGWTFNMNQMMVPAFAGLFFLAGCLLKRARQNYFIGIRTPWTLANAQVWAETHRLGGTAFQIAAIISLAGLFIPDLTMYFILIPILIAGFGSMLLSYVLFRRYQANAS